MASNGGHVDIDYDALWHDLEAYVGGVAAAQLMVQPPAPQPEQLQHEAAGGQSAGDDGRLGATAAPSGAADGGARRRGPPAGAASSSSSSAAAAVHARAVAAVTGIEIVSKYSWPMLFAALEHAAIEEDSAHVSLACRALDNLLASPHVMALSAAVAGSAAAGGAGAAATAAGTSGRERTLLAYVEKGLGSPYEQVRGVAVRFLLRVATGGAPAISGAVQRQQLLTTPTVLPAVCGALTDESPSIAEAAADVMVALAGGTQFISSSARAVLGGAGGRGTFRAGLSVQAAPVAASQPTSITELTTLAGALGQLNDDPRSDDATVRARLLALIARVAGVSDEAFTAVDSVGLLRQVLSAAADTDDVLLQLTVLELLPPLARSRRGFDAIAATGIVSNLLEWSGIEAAAAGGARDDGADPFLGSTALTTLAEIYSAGLQLQAAENLRPRLLPGLAAVVTARCSAGAGSDAALHAVDALVTVMAADAAAIDFVLAQRDVTREWLENGVSATPELRLAALAGLARVIHGAATAVASRGARAASGAAASSGANTGSASASASASTPGTDAPQPGYERYRDLFERLGQHCGKDSVEVCLRCLKLVRRHGV